ncbi:MAG: hypothetical protein ACI4VL_06290 [Bacilli bacterium]
MEIIKKNRGVIIFYLLLVLATLIIVQSNQRELKMENRYVYLTR